MSTASFSLCACARVTPTHTHCYRVCVWLTLRQTFVLKLPNFRFAFRGTCHLTFVKLSFFSRCDVVDNGPFWSGPGDGVAIPTLCSGRVVLFGLKGPRPPQKVRISADFRPNLAFEPNPRRNFRFSGRNFRFSAKT